MKSKKIKFIKVIFIPSIFVEYEDFENREYLDSHRSEDVTININHIVKYNEFSHDRERYSFMELSNGVNGVVNVSKKYLDDLLSVENV